jgi:hypothetical protein
VTLSPGSLACSRSACGTPIGAGSCSPAIDSASPLYYHHTAGRLIFASEVRPLASGLVPRELEPTALWRYPGIDDPDANDLDSRRPDAGAGQVMEVERDGRATTRRNAGSLEAAATSSPLAPVMPPNGASATCWKTPSSHMVSDAGRGVLSSGLTRAVSTLVQPASARRRSRSRSTGRI